MLEFLLPEEFRYDDEAHGGLLILARALSIYIANNTQDEKPSLPSLPSREQLASLPSNET